MKHSAKKRPFLDAASIFMTYGFNGRPFRYRNYPKWFRPMATAKSLKRLRSASNAFLEDGGSLLHGVDSLLQDIQQTLVDLQRREEILVGREIELESREACLNEMLKTLAIIVSSLASIPPSEVPPSDPKPTPVVTIESTGPMPLTLIAERREPSGEARENSAKQDGLRCSVTVNSPMSAALGTGPTAESKLAKELAEIQSTVAEVVLPDRAPETEKAPATAAASTQRFSNHRKKRRR